MTWRYLLRRVAQVPVTLVAVLAVTFVVVYFLPEDPAALLAGETATPEQIEEIRRAYGFDRPLVSQFVSYLARVARGDLGYSYGRGQPVADIIVTLARPTLLLSGTALVVSTLVGTVLATVAVRRPFGRRDRAINTAMLVIYAVPGFWIAQLAILFLVLELNLFPSQGYSRFGTDAPTGLGHLADVGRHLMLPAMILALTEVAAVTRVVRAGLLGELGAGYVRTAAAKGLDSERVLSHHALRNAMRPMVTLIGARVGFLLSGAAIIESIFVWPGLGSVLVSAVSTADRPLMLGMTLVFSAAVITANLATDLVVHWIDPRVRYE